MEILQLAVQALNERIEQELEENPVLDIAQEDPDLPSDEIEPMDSPDKPTVEERELVIDGTDNAEDFERLMNMDEEWPDHFEERISGSRASREEASQRKLDAMANMTARPQTLADSLHDQLGWFDLTKPVREMANRIVYSLDHNGYLPMPLEDLVGSDATDEQTALAEESLRLVQKLDPPGVGARNLRECLLLQLTPEMPFREQLETLISDHLPDIEHNRLPQISRATGYSLELINETLEHLRRLNPKPGADFDEETAPPVVPDLFVEQNDDGKFVVRLEEGETPSLYISPYYRNLFHRSDTTQETREYIRRKVSSAQWLIDSIQQRRSTLTRVAQAIVDHQTAFLERGPEAIEPLTMQQIADVVDLHVTTVSRAVADKWIQTPRAIYPLKRFFRGGTTGADGEQVAWDAVRLKLKELVDAEDKRKPLSDDALKETLAEAGINVARRTIAKYRQELNIPSSRERRQWGS